MKKAILVVALLFAVNLAWSQWEPDIRLTNNPGASWTPMSSCKPIATSGNSVHVVWQDFRDNNAEIYYKRSTDGGTTWGEDIRLSNALGNSYDPSLALSGSVVHVVWSDFRNGSNNVEIYYKRSEDGGSTWGEDTQLTFSGSWSESPSIAIEDTVIHLIWYDWRNATGDWDYEVYYKRSTDGGLTWGTDTRLTNNPSYSGFPCVAVSGSVVHVVWEDDRDGNGEVYYKRSDDGGLNWGPDTQLTIDPADSWDPTIAVNDSIVHVVWMDKRDGGDYEIYYKRSTDAGITWGADTRLTNAVASSEYPTIAVSGSIVHVTWGDQRDMNYEIYYKRSEDAGVIWDEDTRLTNAFGESNYPFVAVSDSAVHVIWRENRDGNTEIYYKHNPTGNIIVGIDNDLAGDSRQQFSVFPNPVSDHSLHIAVTLDKNADIISSLFNRTGTIIGQQSLNGIRGNNELLFKIPDVAPGLYLLKVQYGNEVMTTKVVVN